MPTWKPETVAKPWKTSDYVLASKIRRTRIGNVRMVKARKDPFAFKRYAQRHLGPPLHMGPCLAPFTTDKLSIRDRLKGKKPRRKCVSSGKGHRVAGFSRAGKRVWHPRYADVRMCLVCKTVLPGRPITLAPKPGL